MFVLALGVDPTVALLWSPMVLSFGLPFALIPLLRFTRDRAVTGALANRPLTTACGALAAVAVIGLHISALLL